MQTRVYYNYFSYLCNKIKNNILKMTNPEETTSRNIEIKAKVTNLTEKIKIAKELTGKSDEIIEQHDVFFRVASGRLKLRYLKNAPSQLVQYSRSDIAGPKLSRFNVLEVAQPELLHQMLSASIGVLGEVKKTRHLFIFKQTRIHLDEVEGLGTFLEFEVCLQPEQTVEYGTEIAKEMSKLFEIQDSDLITGAYMDELLKSK